MSYWKAKDVRLARVLANHRDWESAESLLKLRHMAGDGAGNSSCAWLGCHAFDTQGAAEEIQHRGSRLSVEARSEVPGDWRRSIPDSIHEELFAKVVPAQEREVGMITPVQRRSAASKRARASQKAAEQARKLVTAALGDMDSPRGDGSGEGADSSHRTTSVESAPRSGLIGGARPEN